jgi:hypothetical protein
VLGRETSVDRVSVLRHIRTDDALRRRCDEDARGHADTQSRSYGHGRNFQFSVREMGVNQISTLRHIRGNHCVAHSHVRVLCTEAFTTR